MTSALPTTHVSDKQLPTEAEMFRQIMITVEAAWHNRLSRSQIETWLSNFTGRAFSVAYERQLALWLLCNFVYYNEAEVRHLCRTAFRDYLHFKLTGLHPSAAADLEEAANRVIEGTRFYHSGRPGESGGHVLYYFRQENNLGLGSFLTQPDKLPSHVDTVVFVDDVVLSGLQAQPYINRATAAYDAKKQKVLLTFVSTQQAHDLLHANNINVISCITLDDRCKCFSERSNVFANHPQHRTSCRTFAETYGTALKPDAPLGYSDGQYTFGFYYNTPDNTLPLFWSESAGWRPVMKRYDKIYGKGGLNELGHFI